VHYYYIDGSIAIALDIHNTRRSMMRVVSVLMMLGFCSSLNAATITYVGSTEGGEVAD